MRARNIKNGIIFHAGYNGNEKNSFTGLGSATETSPFGALRITKSPNGKLRGAFLEPLFFLLSSQPS